MADVNSMISLLFRAKALRNYTVVDVMTVMGPAADLNTSALAPEVGKGW